MMLMKPSKGARKAEQHAKTLARNGGVAIKKKCRIGNEQDAWNRERREEWVREGLLKTCIFPRPGEFHYGLDCRVVVGHIEDRSLEPKLRMSKRNVAPIWQWQNDKMKFDHNYRTYAQRCMRVWVQRNVHGR